MFPLLMTLHVLGLILWIGGAAGAAKAAQQRRWFLYKMAHPGMALTIASGAWMLWLNSGYFFKEGWLYAKLACAALAVAATVRPQPALLWAAAALATAFVFFRPF